MYCPCFSTEIAFPHSCGRYQTYFNLVIPAFPVINFHFPPSLKEK